jgi:hypothetical protein
MSEGKDPNHGPRLNEQRIAWCFISDFNANLLAEMLCGFFSVKTKLFKLLSALQRFSFFRQFPFDIRLLAMIRGYEEVKR